MGGPQRLRGSGDERRQQPGGGKRGDDCESAAREGRQARYYQFTMPQSADITVLLESEDADTVLYLREGGEVTSGATTSGGFNEGESEYNYRRASIEQTLAASTHQQPPSLSFDSQFPVGFQAGAWPLQIGPSILHSSLKS